MTRASAPPARDRLQRALDLRGLLAGLVALSALWLTLKAGPPLDPLASGLIGLRGVLPVLVILASLGWLAWRRPDPAGLVQDGGPALALAAYGLVGLAAGLWLSPEPAVSLYWGLAYLAVPCLVLVLQTRPDRLATSRDLVRLTWLFVVGLVFVLLAVGYLRYGLANALRDLGSQRLYGNRPADPGLFFLTANGMARFCAIGGILAATALAMGPTGSRLGWGLVGLVSLFGLAVTVSRTAIVGFALALALVAVLRFGVRRVGLAAGVLAAGALVTPLGPALFDYVTRGASLAQLTGLHGRVGYWQATLEAIGGSPVIGFGFQTDRMLAGGHMHDAWFHALIQAGVVGLALFVVAWGLAWGSAARAGLLQGFENLRGPERRRAVEAVAVLALLSVRALPESTAAFFGVDLLVFLPVATYLFNLGRHDRSPRGSLGRAPSREPEPRRVLACAYACSPPDSEGFAGGEELLGWKLAREIGRRFDAHALVDERHRGPLEAARGEREAGLPFTPVYVDLPSVLSPLRRVQGGIQLYAYLWQAKAALVAERLHDEHGFDVYHHLTYANDWMASHAGATLDAAYVRGPGGGAHAVPDAFRARYGPRFALGQSARTLLQHLLRADPFFRRGQRRAQALLVCTDASLEALPDDQRAKAELFPVNGFDPHRLPPAGEQPRTPPGEGLEVVHVGKLLPHKGPDLALEAFERFQDGCPGARLRFVGDGPARDELREQAERLGVADSVRFEGWLEHARALERLAEADVLLFPSLRDGGGMVVVEAMALGTVPVCLDLHGPGLHAAHGRGALVPARSPDQAVRDLAEALTELHRDPDYRRVLSRRAREHARETYTWARLGDRIAALYREAAGEPEPAQAPIPSIEPEPLTEDPREA